MNDPVNFYFDDQVFETMSKNHIYLGTNFKTCSCCDKLIENISPVTLFHNYCCYNREDRSDTLLIEEEILFVTYYLNHYNKKQIMFHLKNIDSMKYAYPDYIQEYLNSYIQRINKQINL